MIKNVKKIWEDDYKPLSTLANEQPDQQQPSPRVTSQFELFSRQAQMPYGAGDEFDNYITIHLQSPLAPKSIELWPGITQHALDLLSIPAMSAKLECVFSKAKRRITSDWNAVEDHTIEVLELMSYWWKQNIISQPRGRRQPRERSDGDEKVNITP